MASIRRRGSTWQVQVRRQGYPPLARFFHSRGDALAWARDQECRIDRAELPLAIRDLRTLTLGHLLRRYRDTVTPTKRGAPSESYRLQRMIDHELSGLALAKLSPVAIANYRDERLRTVQAGSVRRELAILQHCLELARKEWGIGIARNPVRDISVPEPGRARERRLETGELELLVRALGPRSARYMGPLIELAIETGMRRGELLSVRWSDFDPDKGLLKIQKTKNGRPRTVPLTVQALTILRGMPRTTDRIFPMTANAVRLAWERLRVRAGIADLRLHDLRHEAVSRFFELGLTTPEVALISGHRDPRMLLRYTHLRPEAVAEKLQTSTEPSPSTKR
jgi:integrase